MYARTFYHIKKISILAFFVRKSRWFGEGLVNRFYFNLIKLLKFIKCNRCQVTVVKAVIGMSTLAWRVFCRSSLVRKKNGLNVLAFNRSIFCRDLIEIQRRTDINIYLYPLIFHTNFVNAFIPERLQSQICYHLKYMAVLEKSEMLTLYCEHDHDSSDFDGVEKEDLYKVVLPILRELVTSYNIDVFLTANLQYYQDQEWIRAANDESVLFVSLVKEGIGSPKSTRDQIGTYKDLQFQYKGNRALVYSDEVRDLVIKSEVMDSENVIVSGSPRTDLVYSGFFKNRASTIIDSENDVRYVVFFDFYEYSNTWLSSNKERLWRESISTFIAAAEENTNQNMVFVIKTKNHYYTKLVTKEFLDKLRQNPSIVIIDHLNFAEIAQRAVAIVGFRSTALVKFMRTDIPLLILNWAEAKSDKDDNMFDVNAFPNAMIDIDSVDTLRANLTMFINNPVFDSSSESRSERDQIVYQHLNCIDGKRSERVNEILKDCVEENSAKQS